MSFYNDRVLPHLLSLAMRNKDLEAYRRRLVPAAEGRAIPDLHAGYMAGPRPFTFMYEGRASKG